MQKLHGHAGKPPVRFVTDNGPLFDAATGDDRSLRLWFVGGFVPQLTVWIAYTMLVGMLLGAVVVAIGKPKPSATA
ncbi:MAG: hypothetical protein HC794_06395 [Nitrospiraceae bacterium]|nr:hypothetical protein [Nitrospiraceae bacterium]